MAERKSLTGAALGALSNAAYVDALYEEYQRDPSSVGAEWQTFFQGFDLLYDIVILVLQGEKVHHDRRFHRTG